MVFIRGKSLELDAVLNLSLDISIMTSLVNSKLWISVLKECFNCCLFHKKENIVPKRDKYLIEILSKKKTVT